MKFLVNTILICTLFFACNKDDDTNTPGGGNTPCTNTPTLTTNAATQVTDSSAMLSGKIVPPTCNSSVTSQGFVWSLNVQPKVTDSVIELTGSNLEYAFNGLKYQQTYYYRTYYTNVDGTFYGNEVSFVTDTLPNPVYLDSNGVTIKAYPWAKIGQYGVINGISYRIVSESQLRLKVQNNQDVSKVCVSKVSNMDGLFSYTAINQDISTWDVSNVTNMESMFQNTRFNQPINSWDVSNVTNMKSMFRDSYFNQPINNWNVSSVTDMSNLFHNNHDYNQPLGDWDVSSVTKMTSMFQNSNFNQQIDSWDVSNVLVMDNMFAGDTTFNQQIGSWAVGSVVNMNSMFESAINFNSDLSNWNVSNVTKMDEMFKNTITFNQDLSNWNVTSVTQCYEFSQGATSWLLAKPNFTNCSP